MPAGVGAPALASVAWRGQFLDQGSAGQSIGTWPPYIGSEGGNGQGSEGGPEFASGGTGGLITGREAGPIALFDVDAHGKGDVLVMSPLTNFMASSLGVVQKTAQVLVRDKTLSASARFAIRKPYQVSVVELV